MSLQKFDTIFKTVKLMLDAGEFLAADELENMALDDLRVEKNYEVKMLLKRHYRNEINTQALLAELELLKFGGNYRDVIDFYAQYLNQGGRN